MLDVHCTLRVHCSDKCEGKPMRKLNGETIVHVFIVYLSKTIIFSLKAFHYSTDKPCFTKVLREQ